MCSCEYFRSSAAAIQKSGLPFTPRPENPSTSMTNSYPSGFSAER